MTIAKLKNMLPAGYFCESIGCEYHSYLKTHLLQVSLTTTIVPFLLIVTTGFGSLQLKQNKPKTLSRQLKKTMNFGSLNGLA